MKNSFKALIDDETLGMSNETTWIHAKQSLNVINGSDSEEVDQGLNLSPKQSEVRHVIHENNLSLFVVLESHVASSRLERLCASVFRHWNWTSNGNWCSKGTHIILRWNSNLVDVIVIDQMDQAMHVRVWIKMDKNELFCSLHYVRNRPWCILGDFNAALYLEDSTAGSSRFDISIREFKECVEEIEVMDVVRMGLQFTWNQKPKGNDGILKKINHIMTNLEFNDTFIGAHAIFMPYRVSDHAPAILKIPLITKMEQRPFKFTYLLVHNDSFKSVVQEGWSMQVSGFFMFQVVRRLKLLKKHLRKLLFMHGNLHENVKKLRFELEQVQIALVADPFNCELRTEEAAYVHAFNDALLMEEQFLKQKSKIKWLKLGDSNNAYFHKAVKNSISRSRIEAVMESDGTLLTNDQVATGFVKHYEDFLGQAGHTSVFNMDRLF
ncbi:RNA-directed DNA polymerase, eukaryota, reverse transcriptase zinc-binding domain protein [Tanacetum coccineum]